MQSSSMVRHEFACPDCIHLHRRPCLLSLGHLVDLDLHHAQGVIACELVAVVELENQHLPHRHLQQYCASARALPAVHCAAPASDAHQASAEHVRCQS